MKIEQLNSSTDGHREVTATGITTKSAYVMSSPAAATYDSVVTGRYTPPVTGGWDRPDATPMTRTDSYSSAGKTTDGCKCRGGVG